LHENPLIDKVLRALIGMVGAFSSYQHSYIFHKLIMISILLLYTVMEKNICMN